ncbi:MAG: hypothetical protein PHN18_10175 [Sulfurospirillaceae bacterium]|nr:hypothetical protein [Sulfurospirillaceae bacterium]MDD2826987.1 hypothetical protein [Sulfurospirillaceae bacterium]
MPNRYETINSYLSKGIIEANIDFAKHAETSFCLAKFGFEVDLEDGFFFKELISFIHTQISFNVILQQPNDTFLLLLRDYKIHNAKMLMNKLEHAIKHKFKIEIKNIGITLFDTSDTYKSLVDRLDKYYIMSKLSSRKKIFYGTLDFDFYETQSRNDALTTILKKDNKATLYNLYNGLPIKEEINIAKFEEGVAQIKIASSKIHFYAKEEFTFIQHEKIPNIMKARIIKVDPIKSLLVLNHLEFLDASPVDRGDIRVQPERRINATLLHNKIKILDAAVANISESSVAINAKIGDIEKLLDKDFLDKEMELEFQIPTDKSFLTKISTKAVIFSIINEMIVLNISPNVFMKSKLRQYIALRQNGLLVNLKQYLRGIV